MSWHAMCYRPSLHLRIKRHYTALLDGPRYGGDADRFLRDLLPGMMPGLLGATMHPTLTMGYGYRDERMN